MDCIKETRRLLKSLKSGFRLPHETTDTKLLIFLNLNYRKRNCLANQGVSYKLYK